VHLFGFIVRISLYMYRSTRIYWFLLNVAINKSRNTHESFFIHCQMQSVCNKLIYVCVYIYICIQGVTGGTDQTSGGCSLC
jgi:hypothetical protein